MKTGNETLMLRKYRCKLLRNALRLQFNYHSMQQVLLGAIFNIKTIVTP